MFGDILSENTSYDVEKYYILMKMTWHIAVRHNNFFNICDQMLRVSIRRTIIRH
jgi:hypothetical protein